MEPDAPSTNVEYKPPPLNSNQLNYLIWRYLQESGYAEAAVKLQRDWKIEPETLPCAKHIQRHALIRLVQKGLKFHHLSQTFDENGGQTRPLTPSMFFFGAESAGDDGPSTHKESLLKVPDYTRAISPASTIAYSSKVRRDTASAAPEESVPQSIKRGRKAGGANSERNGGASRKVSGPDVDIVNGNTTHPERGSSPAPGPTALTNGNHDDRMEVEHENVDGDIHMDEVEEALPPLIPTLTNGESKAVQVIPTKVTNLLPSSAVLSVDSPNPLIQAVWQPNRMDVLVAQSHSFCGSWNLYGQDLTSGSVKPSSTSIFPSDYSGLITAATWDHSGSVLAVATFSEEQGQIYLFEGDNLTLIETLPASQRAVTLLKWHSNGTSLIGISPDVGMDGESLPGSSVLCWNVTPGQEPTTPSVLSLPSSVLAFDLGASGRDVDIFVAGYNSLFHCRYNTTTLHLRVQGESRPAPNRPAKEWTLIKAGGLHQGRPIVVLAAAESSTVWLPYHDIWDPMLHDGEITGLEIQPRIHDNNISTIHFTTSGNDGTIAIWQVRENGTVCTHRIRFEVPSPVMAISYSHDGRYLAGAGYTRAQIWDTQQDCRLIAQWTADSTEWRGASIQDSDDEAASRASVNGDGSINAQHSLSWHDNSKRLALGLGSQIAVINFQRSWHDRRGHGIHNSWC